MSGRRARQTDRRTGGEREREGARGHKYGVRRVDRQTAGLYLRSTKKAVVGGGDLSDE